MTTLSQLAQLQLELINRARMDPAAEAARYGISLNEFIDPAKSGVITADPKQVLAGNNQLTAAAVGHTAQMLAMNSMSHSGIGDFDPATRIANAGYTGNNVRRPENIGQANAFANNSDPTKLPTEQQYAVQFSETSHMGLFRDKPGVDTSGNPNEETGGHRLAMLDPNYREVGIGVTLQYTNTGNSVSAKFFQTQNFGNHGTQSFLTGAVYNDTNKDNFYSLGEAVSGVTVTVRNAANAVIGSDTTGAGGGWSVGEPGGTYKVTFSGAGKGDISATIESGSLNAKMDLVNGNEIYANANTTLNEGAVGLRLIGIQNINGTGNGLANVITGNAGANILTGMGGNDTIDGQGGSDTVVFTGKQSDYKIVINGNTATLEDLRAGSADGLDTITNIELVKFSDITVAYSSLRNQIPAVNHAPTVAVADKTLAASALASLSPWVSYSDPDNNPAAQYQIIDNGTGANSGQLIAPNGTVVAPGTTLTVSAADLANVKIKGGSVAGTESFQIRAFDGTDWSAWDSFNLTTTAPVNRAPTVAVADHTLKVNETANVSTWLSYFDADNNVATQFQFIDNGTAADSGFLSTATNAHVAAGTTLTVSAAELANLVIHGGAVAGTETMQVRAFDGTDWSAWDSFVFTTQALPVNHAPVATINDHALKINEWAHVSDWISYSDADGNPAVQYQFVDLYANATSGYFWTPDNEHHAANEIFTVNAADVGNVWVRGAQGAGWENMQVRVFDGTTWSAWDTFKITTLANQAPVVAVADHSVKTNEWVRLSDWISYSDANGDKAVRYEFVDKYASATSGYFWTPDNEHHAANEVFSVEAADLASVWVRGGQLGGWENMQVRVFDGISWSAWDNFRLTSVANAAPVATINDQSVSKNQWVSLSSLISYTDANGDAPVQYQLVDNGTGTNSGYFYTPDNPHHAAGEVFTVNAADLANVYVRGGAAAGLDTMQVRAFDGTSWGAWDSFKFTTLNNTAPTIDGDDFTFLANQRVAASSLFSAFEPDAGDAITQYQFFDDTPGEGYFSFKGVQQKADTTITVAAKDLAKLTFVASADAGVDQLWVRASDGTSWSDWHTFHAATIL